HDPLTKNFSLRTAVSVAIICFLLPARAWPAPRSASVRGTPPPLPEIPRTRRSRTTSVTREPPARSALSPLRLPTPKAREDWSRFHTRSDRRGGTDRRLPVRTGDR